MSSAAIALQAFVKSYIYIHATVLPCEIILNQPSSLHFDCHSLKFSHQEYAAASMLH